MPVGPIVDPQTGEMTMEFRTWLEELTFGTSENSIGTILSGQSGIINGTTQLADVNISGRGSLIAEQDAQSNNINSTASAGGGLVVSADQTYSFGGGTSGTIQTDTRTISISGGTPPYTITSAFVSGSDVFTETITGSPLAADGDVSIYFRTPWSSGLTAYAVERVTVSDSAAASKTVDLSVTAIDSSGIGGA